MKNRYYLIEPIDIDGDKNPDGFLVSQYRIDKKGNKIFLKNKYITYKLFKEKIKSKTGGKNNVKNIPPQSNVVYVNEKGYNANMNTKYYPNHNQPYRSNSQEYPYNPHQNPYNPHQNPYNPHQNPYNPHQNPYNQPQVMVRDNNSFGGNLMSGVGLGLGFSFGSNVMNEFFN